MKIVFPELNHPNIQAALAACPDITPIPASDLDSACELVHTGAADALIAGIDYSSRDVILACRNHFPMAEQPNFLRPLCPHNPSTNALPSIPSTPASPNDQPVSPTYSTFSGLAVMQKGDQTYLLADMAACKHPSKDQLREIIAQTYVSASKILSLPPRLALLSFSTLGSGGKDDFITLAQELVQEFSSSNIIIDGEMQLDAAINPVIGQKKAAISPVAGQANVLIAPDLNTGNILYKAFEQIGGYTVAGPILQGFSAPVSDLSRGSTAEDVILTIQSLSKLVY